jgi:hypothetical protein
MSVRASEQLTAMEQKCCHMSQWGVDGHSLQSWRDEFVAIPTSEHCRDCPLLAERAKAEINRERNGR